MAIPSVAGAATNGTDTQTQIKPNDAMGKQEFLKILMLQLRNQDPLNPMNDREFIGQMAQLSTLEATQSLGSQIDVLTSVQLQSQAMQYVGHDVQYLNEAGSPATGKVAAVKLDSFPPTLVMQDKSEIPCTWVTTVL